MCLELFMFRENKKNSHNENSLKNKNKSDKCRKVVEGMFR